MAAESRLLLQSWYVRRGGDIEDNVGRDVLNGERRGSKMKFRPAFNYFVNIVDFVMWGWTYVVLHHFGCAAKPVFWS